MHIRMAPRFFQLFIMAAAFLGLGGAVCASHQVAIWQDQTNQAIQAVIAEVPNLEQSFVSEVQALLADDIHIGVWASVLPWCWEHASTYRSVSVLQEVLHQAIMAMFTSSLADEWQDKQVQHLMCVTTDLVTCSMGGSKCQRDAVGHAVCSVLLTYGQVKLKMTQEACQELLGVLGRQFVWLASWYEQEGLVMPHTVHQGWALWSSALVQYRIAQCGFWETGAFKRYVFYALVLAGIGGGTWLIWQLCKERVEQYIAEKSKVVREGAKQDVKDLIGFIRSEWQEPSMQELEAMVDRKITTLNHIADEKMQPLKKILEKDFPEIRTESKVLCSEIKHTVGLLRNDMMSALATVQEASPGFNREKFVKCTTRLLKVQDLLDDQEKPLSQKVQELEDLLRTEKVEEDSKSIFSFSRKK